MLTRLKELFCKCIGRLQSSHRLNDDRNLRIRQYILKIMRQHLLGGISRKVPEIQDTADFDLFSEPAGDHSLIHPERLKNARSDRAVAHDSNFRHIHIPLFYSC